MVSALVTVLMLGIAFAVMIMSLNLQGYIHPNHNPDRWDDENDHPFHYPYLASLAEEGNLFDATSLVRSLIPVVIHVACISTLNGIYRRVATFLTAWENHETELDHLNSIVLKRFLFEAFDCYVALFYLAFYERNVERLRGELVSVFQIDTMRRVLLECGVPMIIQSFQQGHFVLPKSWNSFTHRPPTPEEIIEDLEKDDYDPFDDYMEILIQLGCKRPSCYLFLDTSFKSHNVMCLSRCWRVCRCHSFCFSLSSGIVDCHVCQLGGDSNRCRQIDPPVSPSWHSPCHRYWYMADAHGQRRLDVCLDKLLDSGIHERSTDAVHAVALQSDEGRVH